VSERKRIYRDADGVRRTMVWDDEDPNQVAVVTEQDVEPILDGIHRDREIMTHGVNKLAARIPVSIYERAIHQQWDEDDWTRWLNSDEGAPWRVWRGRV
jgi:hypothetical protein